MKTELFLPIYKCPGHINFIPMRSPLDDSRDRLSNATRCIGLKIFSALILIDWDAAEVRWLVFLILIHESILSHVSSNMRILGPKDWGTRCCGCIANWQG